MKKQFILHRIFNPKNIQSLEEEMGTNDPFFLKIKLIQDDFTDLVSVMKKYEYFSNPSINELMSLFYLLVGNKISPVAVNDAVSALNFWCETTNRQSLSVVMLPLNWHEMLIEDAYMQMGAMVFAASQSKDYWNNRFIPDEKKEIHKRASSYEAELLHYFLRNSNDFKPNEYQKKIMNNYPNGIASVDSHYEGREFDHVGPPFPVKT